MFIQDRQKFEDAISIKVDRNRFFEDDMKLAGHFHIEARHANGELFNVQDVSNIVTTAGKNALAAYLANSSPTSPFMKYMEIGTKGTTTSSSITGNSTSSGPTFTVGSDITGATSPSFIELNGGGNIDVCGVTVSGTTYTFATTTLASTPTANQLAEGIMPLTSAANFVNPANIAGGVAYFQIVNSGTLVGVYSYTGISSNNLTGCLLVTTGTGSPTSGYGVYQNPQNSYSGITTVSLVPQKGDTTNGTALGARVTGTDSNPSGAIFQNVGVFTGYSGSVCEVGLFDASSSGNMFVHGVFGIITIASADTLTITYKITFI